MTVAGNLKSMFQPGPFRDAKILTVVGLADDTTSVVASDGVTEDVYPCGSSYLYRAIGDQVVAVQLAGGAWLVWCALAAAAQDVPPTLAEVKALIPVVPDNPIVTVAWGTTAPSGTGWVHPDSMWLKTTAGGDIQLYGQMAAPPAVVVTPKPPAVVVPADITRSANDAGAWRTSGTQDSDTPKAGSWTGADWYGGWFFGDEIAAACAGKTVAAMHISVARLDNGTGWNRGVPLRLGLHTKGSRGRPSLSNKWSSGTLSPGQRRSIAVPSLQRTKLASGSMKGFGVYGSGSGDYAQFSRSASVHIEFA